MNTLNLMLDLIVAKKNCKKDPKNEIDKIIGNSKSGYLKVEKISDNIGYLIKGETFEGYTPMFAEGVAAYMFQPNDIFHTSVIVEINWDKHIIRTLNSEYRFEFLEITDLDKLLEEYKNESLRTM